MLLQPKDAPHSPLLYLFLLVFSCFFELTWDREGSKKKEWKEACPDSHFLCFFEARAFSSQGESDDDDVGWTFSNNNSTRHNPCYKDRNGEITLNKCIYSNNLYSKKYVCSNNFDGLNSCVYLNSKSFLNISVFLNLDRKSSCRERVCT